jgi:ribosomal protein S27E
LPAGAEALDEPFSAFPSWFLRIECDRCGKVQMVNEAPQKRADRLNPHLCFDRMRHAGCGGRAARLEMITGIEGTHERCSGRPDDGHSAALHPALVRQDSSGVPPRL